MKLIERYIFARASSAALVTLGSLAGVVWIIQALRQIDVITTNGQTILTYLALTTLIIPMLVLAVIPVSLLLATVFTVNTLNSNSELVVINSSGASSMTIARPLILLALICSLFTGYVGHFVSPWSLVKLNLFAAQMRADLVSVLVREGEFSTIEKGLMFHVARREAGGVLSGILISDDRDPDKSIIFTASKGVVSRNGDEALLLLKDGQIQQRSKGRDGLTTIRYDSYVFDLATFTRKLDTGGAPPPKQRTTLQLLNPDPSDPFYKEKPGLYRAQIHERFSEMLWPFAYVLVMLAFAGQARSNRQGHGSAIGSAMMLLTLLRGAAFSAVGASKGSADAVVLVYALPLFAIFFGAWFVITSYPVALSPRVQRRLDAQNERLKSKVEEWRNAYLDWQRRKFSGVQT